MRVPEAKPYVIETGGYNLIKIYIEDEEYRRIIENEASKFGTVPNDKSQKLDHGFMLFVRPTFNTEDVAEYLSELIISLTNPLDEKSSSL